MRFISCYLLFVALCLSTVSNAQSKFYRGTIGLSSGTTQYNGEIINDFYSLRTTNPFSALNYSHYASTRCDLRLGVAFGSWGYKSEMSNSFDADFVNANVDLKIKLIARDNPRWSPYIFLGMGVNQFSNWTLMNSSDEVITNDTDGRNISQDDMHQLQAILSGGPGVQVRLAERVFLNVEERFLFPYSDASDGVQREIDDNMLRHTIGISFGLFPWSDTDKDGVSDKDDLCPLSPSIAKVDEFGCPIDSDRDGIADFEDACAEMPGVITGNGCPDADGDGFVDAIDVCPYKSGIATFGGCPDTDGDGIKDDDDLCPEIKGLMKFKGCVDTDNDGVADPDDICKNTPAAAKVDSKGCPLDTDKDGVADYQDQCPTDAGTNLNKGCPEVKEEVVALLKRALNGIKFETGKDIIKKESFVILDSVAVVMRTNPSYKLSIYGHTDNVGDPQKNLELSTARANAVANYLLLGGLQGRILETKGFGDQKPVADNATKEGRTLNRRVEFVVEY